MPRTLLRRLRPAASALLGLAVVHGAPSATAGTTTRTATFTVSVIVDNDCQISSSNPLSFGHAGFQSGDAPLARFAQTDQLTRLSVACSRNTRYTLYLDQGSVAGSTVLSRLMAGSAPGNTDRLQYQLYLDPSYSTVWGDGSSGSAGSLGGVGSGAAQVYTVYGRILPQDLPSADLYSSIITASLTF